MYNIYMKKYLILGIIIVTISFVLYIFSINKSNICNGGNLQIKVGDKIVNTIIANTDNKREKGLSQFPSLKSNESMIFIFDYDLIPKFWMKDMLFPLHIFWIDNNYVIYNVEENVLPNTYPNTFSPKAPIRFVLETSVEFSENPKEYIGKKIEFICGQK